MGGIIIGALMGGDYNGHKIIMGELSWDHFFKYFVLNVRFIHFVRVAYI